MSGSVGWRGPLHTFSSSFVDGGSPSALIEGSDGYFYGATARGGKNNAGTIFRLSSSGDLSTLHSFSSEDGSSPSALIEASDGSFYGTFSRADENGAGTIFKIQFTGELTTLHSFSSSDGSFPYTLVEADVFHGSLFLGDGDPGCDDACDCNDDGAVDISDAINTLGVLFLGNGAIPLPGMTECGVDPTPDDVGCETFSQCP